MAFFITSIVFFSYRNHYCVHAILIGSFSMYSITTWCSFHRGSVNGRHKHGFELPNELLGFCIGGLDFMSNFDHVMLLKQEVQCPVMFHTFLEAGMNTTLLGTTSRSARLKISLHRNLIKSKTQCVGIWRVFLVSPVAMRLECSPYTFFGLPKEVYHDWSPWKFTWMTHKMLMTNHLPRIAPLY